MDIVIIGLSITSSWGNGHATTYRSLVKALSEQGHNVLFMEKDVPWYASQRDMPNPPFGQCYLYRSNKELKERYAEQVKTADLVIVGSYVQQGVEVGAWVMRTAKGVKAFYDIDTPVTLAKLQREDYEYLEPSQIARYDLYLSFTGGPILDKLKKEFGSPDARALYCSVDPELYFPDTLPAEWDLGYLGTYSMDRQPPLERLMLDAARKWPEGRFIVAGPQYPEGIRWPDNVDRIQHLPPARHRWFYNTQRYTQNITRADMVKAGYCPSVRLFEAAACGVPVISDYWDGLSALFEPGKEIFISGSSDETLQILKEIPEKERRETGLRARKKVLEKHAASKRAEQLIQYVQEVNSEAVPLL